MNPRYDYDQNVVLYTHDLEPITIFKLSKLAINHLQWHGVVSIPVYPPLPSFEEMTANDRDTIEFKRVNIELGTFVWKRQERYILLTRDEESALLLKAAFLPGQQSAMNEKAREDFARGFLMGMVGLGK